MLCPLKPSLQGVPAVPIRFFRSLVHQGAEYPSRLRAGVRDGERQIARLVFRVESVSRGRRDEARRSVLAYPAHSQALRGLLYELIFEEAFGEERADDVLLEVPAEPRGFREDDVFVGKVLLRVEERPFGERGELANCRLRKEGRDQLHQIRLTGRRWAFDGHAHDLL